LEQIEAMAAVFQQVREEVEKQPPGALFALADFSLSPEQAGALTKALSRLYQQGRLRRLMKGLYYKPARGILGEVFPSYDKILRKLLEVYKQNISYITGANVYTELGLSTQVSKEYVIASDKPRSPVKIGTTEVRFVRSHVTEPVADVTPLQLLDAIWDIKNISANNPTQVALILIEQLRVLSASQCQALARYALSYPPQTRALTGLLFETLGAPALARQLKASLNSQTVYQIPLSTAVFPAKRSWNIL
jgi:hypothetical protein